MFYESGITWDVLIGMSTRATEGGGRRGSQEINITQGSGWETLE